MSKKAREKPAEAGSASVSPYGSVLGYELVTSQPNRLINLIWPECRTWFIGPCLGLNRDEIFISRVFRQIHALGLKASCMNLSENSRYKYFVSRYRPRIYILTN